MLVVIALSVNLLGDWLRDALNPRLRLKHGEQPPERLRRFPLLWHRCAMRKGDATRAAGRPLHGGRWPELRQLHTSQMVQTP